MKVPKAYHDAAAAAAAHAGAGPALLDQVTLHQLRNWQHDKAVACKAAGLREWRLLLSDLIQEQMEQLIQQLEQEEGAHWFIKPVNTNQLPDYAKEVAYPMCLDVIKKALHNGQYKLEPPQQQRPPLRLHGWQSLCAFAHDLQLIVSNARLYNGGKPDNRVVLDAAAALQSKAVMAWSRVQANISSKLKQRLEAHRQQQQQQ